MSALSGAQGQDRAPKIKVRWTRSRHVRITATRGAVTTEATLTEAEATQLAHQLDKVLNGQAGPAGIPAGEPPG